MGFGWRRKSRNTNKVPPLEEFVIPNHFLCPVSLDLMKDPVTVSSGITYDRDSIEKWLQGGNFTCPVTKKVLTSFDQIPNHTLRKMIQEWCVTNRHFGVERIPTPRIPVTSLDVSWTLSSVAESVRSGDLDGCLEMVKKIKDWGVESERNKRSIVGNGAGSALSAAFETFAAHPTRTNSILLEEILSVLDWMLPLDVESLHYLGLPASMSCLVRFLETGDLSVRKTAALILKELSGDQKHVSAFVGLGEAKEVLVKLVAQPISSTITKASLSILFNLISSPNQGDQIKPRFVEMGLVEILIEILVDSERSISEKALGVLNGLCSCEEGKERACSHSLTIPVLVKKILRVSDSATEFSVSTLWGLISQCDNWDDKGKILVESLQVGAFQKLLLLLQLGCSDEAKEKVTELLKLLNPYRAGLECIETVDFKNLKRSF